jgi:hypothetical protein
MLIIKHRVNSVKELNEISTEFGIEIDLRANHNKIFLSHDAFAEGVELKNWLKYFNHKFLICNVKEDGLEERILESLEFFGIKEYFFLDQPIPTLIKSISRDYIVASRVSEYETIESAILQNSNWLWIDSFTGNWDHLIPCIFQAKKLGKRVCLVSPELQGRFDRDETMEIKQIILESGIDAVCTKFPELWGRVGDF